MSKRRERFGEKNLVVDARRNRVLAQQAASAGLAAGGDHGRLGGLADDDHLQYLHLSSARTIGAQHTFDVTGAPFVLGAGAQGQLVTGLNADQVDGYHGHAQAHALVGADHTASGLTVGHVVRASGASAFAWAQLGHGDLGGVSADQHHSQAHAITGADHTVTGSAYQVVGLTGTNTLGLLTPQTSVGANEIPIGGTGGAITWEGAQTVQATLTTYNIYAGAGYAYNIGQLTQKYLALHAAELWVETLVAQSTLATIGGRILVGPTTTLTRALAAASTAIYVKHNQMANGDRVYLEANGNLEFIAITDNGVLQAEGDYMYRSTRNLDGSGANDWSAGDAVFNTGTTGDGWIDLYSVAGVAGVGTGPTIVGNVRLSSTYNDWTECWAIGNLNGEYGYATDTYGVGLGKYANSCSFVTVDATNGVRMMSRSGGADTQRAQWDASGNILIGKVAASESNVYITSGALSVRNNTTERIGLSAAGVLTIKDSGGNAIFTFNASTGAEFTKPLTIASTGGIYQGTGTFASPTTGLKVWNDSGVGRIAGYNGGTLQWSCDTNGYIKAGGDKVIINADGIMLDIGAVWDQHANLTWGASGNIKAGIGTYGSGLGWTSRWVMGGASTDQPAISLMNVLDTDYYIVVDAEFIDVYNSKNTGGLGILFCINDTAIGGNSYMTNGIIVDQDAADNDVLVFQSSDVGHGMTTLQETDTFGAFYKCEATSGGLCITGFKDADGVAGMALQMGGGLGETADTTKSTAGVGVVQIDGFIKSGTTGTSIGANGNILAVRTWGTTRFILDADGDSHQDVGTAWTNFDDHDDVALLTQLSVGVSRTADPIRVGMNAFLEEHRLQLERLGLVTFNPDGHHFVNMSRLTMLLVGAIRQIGARVDRLEHTYMRDSRLIGARSA